MFISADDIPETSETSLYKRLGQMEKAKTSSTMLTSFVLGVLSLLTKAFFILRRLLDVAYYLIT